MKQSRGLGFRVWAFWVSHETKYGGLIVGIRGERRFGRLFLCAYPTEFAACPSVLNSLP